MDLLTGYSSDGSDAEDEDVPKPPRHARSTAVSMRPPPAPASKPGSQPSAVNEDRPGGAPVSKLWSSMPAPSTHHAAAVTGLSALPPPSGDAKGVGRKVVTLQLPFRKELLAAALDSDDEDEPATKRIKTTGGKSRLMDFLPPPKYNSSSLGAALGSGGAASRGAAPLKATPTEAAHGNGAAAAQAAAALPSDFFSGDVPLSNEAYRVADEDGAAGSAGYGAGPAAYHDASVGSAGAGPYGPASYAPDYGPPGLGRGAAYGHPAAAGPSRGPGGSGAGPRAAAPQGGEAEAEDLVEAALRAEQERASKRGGGGGGAGGVKLVEINAKDLTKLDPAAREAANSARDALGTDYALSLRRTAAPFEGSKMARRKHQIGTLLFNARMQELDQMEKRTQGQKSKAETAAKYGW